MRFTVVIHKDHGSDYGVTVPDLPGCFSSGATLGEAMRNAREAIELHLQGLAADGEPVPCPRPLSDHVANPCHSGGLWAGVEADAPARG